MSVRRVAAGAALLLFTLVLRPGGTPSAQDLGNALVISEVYGGGGNNGALYTHDFVEIYNRSGAPVSLANLSIQYASATGTGNFGANDGQLTALPAVVLGPGGYFLVQQAAGSATPAGAPLPGADFVDPTPIAMAAGAGKVALVTGTAALGCNGGSTPCHATQRARIVDLVGYGTANFFEGTAAAATLSASQSAARTPVTQDTNQNSVDFARISPPDPQGGGLVAGNPVISVTDATANEAGGAITFTVRLNRVSAVPVFYSIATRDVTAQANVDYVPLVLTSQVIPDGTLQATHTVSLLDDSEDEQPNERFEVVLTDIVSPDAGDTVGLGTIGNDDVPLRTIEELQGDGPVSAFDGRDVVTSGVVTLRKANGFFIQSPDDEADDRPETSNALFVFTSSTPTVSVGDAVRVAGALDEFRGASAELAGTLTEIVSPAVVTLSTGNPLPAPLDLAAILTAPAETREAQLERYEGMLVSVAALDVVAPTNAFGELFGVLPGTARPFREPGVDASQPVPPEAPATVPVFDSNLERIMLDTDDGLTSEGVRRPRINVATRGPGAPASVVDIFGPLDYAFDAYRVVVDDRALGFDARVPAAVPAMTSPEFTIASQNLENFRPTASTPAAQAAFAQRVQKAARMVVEVLRTPDILGVIEVGTKADLEALATAINAAAGTSYEAHLEVTPGSTQNLGYLVNLARVEVIGTPLQYFAGDTWVFEGEADILHDRAPYLLRARIRGSGMPVTVILNHLKSLIGVNSFAPYPAGSTTGATAGERNRLKRRLQAEDLADLVTDHVHENLVVMGDMNAFEFNDGLVDVIGTIKATPAGAGEVTLASADRWSHELVNLADLVPEAARYSYVFDGNAQVLDHILVNRAMRDALSRFTYSRNNADFPERFETDFTVPTRVSDHEGAVAYFVPTADVSVSIDAAAPVVEAGNTIAYTVTVSNAGTAAAQNVVVTDGASTIATIPLLAAGASEQVTFTRATTCDIGNGTVIGGVATASADTVDPDTANNMASALVTVLNAGPTIAGLTASHTELWPANHNMVTVTLGYTAADTCGAVATRVSVTSNEAVNGTGDGDTAPDWIVVDDTRVQLRAERAATGGGRVYAVRVTATDAAGATTHADVAIAVPHSRR